VDNIQDKLSNILSDPKAMERIMDMVRSLSSSAPPAKAEPSEDTPAASPPPELASAAPQTPDSAAAPAAAAAESSDQSPDLSAMLGLLGMLGGGGGQQSALIDALKPYLNPRRAQSLARARQLSSLIQTARLAFGGFLKGGDEHV